MSSGQSSQHPDPGADVGRQLWACATGDGATEEVVAGASRLCAQLALGLEPWIGAAGYRTLLARALEQAGTAHPAIAGLPSMGEDEEETASAVKTHGAAAVAAGMQAAVAGLVKLLGAIIGEAVSARLVEQFGRPIPRGVRNTRSTQRHPGEHDERNRLLVDLSPDGILVHDGAWVVFANAAAVRMAGATRSAELVGLPIDSLLAPPYLKAVANQLADSTSPADPTGPVRDAFHRLDGSELEVMVSAVAFLDHGRPSTQLIIRNTIALPPPHQVAAPKEEYVHHVLHMESVGVLAGGVAHEVNNMMQVVFGFSELLLMDLTLPVERIADVQEIVRAADRAAASANQLLAFSHSLVPIPKVSEPAIPAREPAVPEWLTEPLPVATDPAHSGATVLVVDHEPAVRAIASRILERVGFRPLQAAGGSDALALVDQLGPPHLVLTDLIMPGIDGTELASRLWKRWPTLPVLFMSAYSAKELYRQRAIGADASLIQKPFPPHQLVASVVAALSQPGTTTTPAS